MPDAVSTVEPFWDEFVERAVSRATTWGAAGGGLLVGLDDDPDSVEFTRRLLELLLGDDDAITAALELKRLAPDAPASMPTADRLLLRAGGAVSLGLPWAVVPVAKRWLRDRLSHLVLARRTESGIVEALRVYSADGMIPVVRPVGGYVHGPSGVARETDRLVRLLSQPGLPHVIVDPARLVPGGSDWSADSDAQAAAKALRPVLEAALGHGSTVHLEATSVRWAQLLPEILERAVADPALDRVRTSIGLLAELPESRELYSRLSRWALRRVADGGAPVEVTIGVGTVAASERVTAVLAGLPVAVVEGQTGLVAQMLSLVELALHPGRAAALRPVIASEDPFVIAATIEAAAKLGSDQLFSVRLRAGVAPSLAAQLVPEVPEVRVCVPTTSPREYNSAVDLLVPLALESAAAEASESSAEQVFREAAALSAPGPQRSHRTQSRAREWDPSERDSALFYRAPDEAALFDTGGLTAAVLGLTRGETGEIELTEVTPARAIPVVSATGFANEPDTDGSRAENRDWARRLIELAREDVAARDEQNLTVALSRADIDPARASGNAASAAARWRALGHGQRAIHLRRLALGAVAARDRLLRTLAADTGAPIGVIDAEIGRIVDSARYTGQLAEGLAAVRGATFTPDVLVLVTGDAWAGIAAQAEAVLTALGAGSGVLWAAPAQLAVSAGALVEEWAAAGLPEGSVTLEVLAMPEALTEVAANEAVDRAIVLGDRAAAARLAHRRPDLRVEGRFLSRGSVIVSPTAELSHAVDDVIASAFSGSMLSRANGVIVVGTAGRQRRFGELLADAVGRLRVGSTARAAAGAASDSNFDPLDPLAIEVGPLPAPATPDQRRVLTELERGEHWMVAPESLDEAGTLWRPGVRSSVAGSSLFWSTARGLPIIGVAHAYTFEEAIRMQNAPGGGSVAGLQATSEDEIAMWLDRAEAATLALNRPTSDVRVERQPVGGWNDAVMGLPALDAGPNRLVTLGSWRLRVGTPSSTLHLRGLDPGVAAFIEKLQPEIRYEEFDELRRAALTDSLTWRTSFAPDRDTAGLGVERNVLRYHPVPAHIRLAEGGQVVDLARVISAALLVRAPIAVSTGQVLPAALLTHLSRSGIEVSLEHDNDWLERIAVSGPEAAGGRASRVRLIGGDPVRTAEWLGGLDRVALWAEPVTMAGPVELITLVREQAVSARAHRHGVAVPVPGLDA